MTTKEQIIKEMEQICKSNIEFKNSDIVAKGYNKKTVSKVLHELEQEGKVVRTKSGWLCGNMVKEKFSEFIAFAMRGELKEPVHREIMLRILVMPHLRWITWKYKKFNGELSEKSKNILISFPFLAFSYRDDEVAVIKNALVVTKLFNIEELKSIVENAIRIYEAMINNQVNVFEETQSKLNLEEDLINLMKMVYTTDLPNFSNKDEKSRFLYNLFLFMLTLAVHVDAETVYKVYNKIYYVYYKHFSFSSLVEKILSVENEVNKPKLKPKGVMYENY